MSAAIKERGETALQSPADPTKDLAAGARWKVDGAFLRFRNSDLKRIESARKEAGVESFFTELVDRSLNGTLTFELLELYLANGIKDAEGKALALPEDRLDDVPVHDIMELVFDAVCRSMRGMSAKDYVEETFRAFQEATEDPSKSPASTSLSSTISEGSASGPG